MQEILTIINEARKSGDIPECPVFGAGLGLAVADHLDQISKRTGQAKFSRRTIKELRLRRPPQAIKAGKRATATRDLHRQQRDANRTYA